jgi:hypothetical protein
VLHPDAEGESTFTVGRCPIKFQLTRKGRDGPQPRSGTSQESLPTLYTFLYFTRMLMWRFRNWGSKKTAFIRSPVLNASRRVARKMQSYLEILSGTLPLTFLLCSTVPATHCFLLSSPPQSCLHFSDAMTLPSGIFCIVWSVLHRAQCAAHHSLDVGGMGATLRNPRSCLGEWAVQVGPRGSTGTRIRVRAVSWPRTPT